MPSLESGGLISVCGAASLRRVGNPAERNRYGGTSLGLVPRTSGRCPMVGMGSHCKCPAICSYVRSVAPFATGAAPRRVFRRCSYVRVTYAKQAWRWAGLTLPAHQLEPATARTVLDVALFWGPVLTGATTIMIASVTLLALRGRAGLPWWLGVLGVVAFVEQAAETITIFGSAGLAEQGGAMNLLLGAALDACLRGMGRYPRT